jgi:hypothetical protein
MGWGMTLTFLRWGPRFQMHRKLIQGSFTKPNCVQYQDLQESETHQLVSGIMKNPDDWERQMRRFVKIRKSLQLNSNNSNFTDLLLPLFWELDLG